MLVPYMHTRLPTDLGGGSDDKSGPWWSLGSFGRALVVFGFIWVRSGAPCRSLGSFRFNRERHGGHFECALAVVGFIRVGLVHLGALWGSLGSFIRTLVVVCFIRVRLVHSGALWWSFGRALGVVGFNRVRWVHSGSP